MPGQSDIDTQATGTHQLVLLEIQDNPQGLETDLHQSHLQLEEEEQNHQPETAKL